MSRVFNIKQREKRNFLTFHILTNLSQLLMNIKKGQGKQLNRLLSEIEATNFT